MHAKNIETPDSQLPISNKMYEAHGSMEAVQAFEPIKLYLCFGWFLIQK